MKPRAPSNGLSKRTIRLLVKAGFTLDKDVIIRALQTTELYPYCRPPNYGITTHRELCSWAGVELAALPQGWPDYDRTPYPPQRAFLPGKPVSAARRHCRHQGIRHPGA